MASQFKDHFSDGSTKYSQFRPSYPKELFSYLFSIVKDNKMVWDCATGSGQSAIGLLNYFDKVIATDASENQINNANLHEGITYKVEKSEKSSIESNSIDLITVAQALHWFNIDDFSTEVIRVLKTNGVLAVWTYGLLNVNAEIDKIILELYGSTLESYWPPERNIVEEAYVNIKFPLTELTVPSFQMELNWELKQLIGYLCTWSAVRKYETKEGHNPVEKVFNDISEHWGDPNLTIQTRWPLVLRVWIKNQ